MKDFIFQFILMLTGWALGLFYVVGFSGLIYGNLQFSILFPISIAISALIYGLVQIQRRKL